MSFSFNFALSDNISDGKIPVESTSSFLLAPIATDEDNNPYQEIQKPTISSNDLSFITLPPIGVDNISLRKVVPKNITLDENGSDIIPGKYEGGKKVWECSIDLAKYILSSELSLRRTNSLPLDALELGCGHGLPAIAAVLAYGSENIREVIFADLNVEVLRHITWPNILLNCPEASCCSIRCCSGDWLNLSNHIGKFGLIVSAETLYNAECCKKVFHMIDKHLDNEGVALIASKKYYFGVGGGTFDLEALASAPDSRLQFTLVRSYEDGFSNIREIVKLTRRIEIASS